MKRKELTKALNKVITFLKEDFEEDEEITVEMFQGELIKADALKVKKSQGGGKVDTKDLKSSGSNSRAGSNPVSGKMD